MDIDFNAYPSTKVFTIRPANKDFKFNFKILNDEFINRIQYKINKNELDAFSISSTLMKIFTDLAMILKSNIPPVGELFSGSVQMAESIIYNPIKNANSNVECLTGNGPVASYIKDFIDVYDACSTSYYVADPFNLNSGMILEKKNIQILEEFNELFNYRPVQRSVSFYEENSDGKRNYVTKEYPEFTELRRDIFLYANLLKFLTKCQNNKLDTLVEKGISIRIEQGFIEYSKHDFQDKILKNATGNGLVILTSVPYRDSYVVVAHIVDYNNPVMIVHHRAEGKDIPLETLYLPGIKDSILEKYESLFKDFDLSPIDYDGLKTFMQDVREYFSEPVRRKYIELLKGIDKDNSSFKDRVKSVDVLLRAVVNPTSYSMEILNTNITFKSEHNEDELDDFFRMECRVRENSYSSFMETLLSVNVYPDLEDINGEEKGHEGYVIREIIKEVRAKMRELDKLIMDYQDFEEFSVEGDSNAVN